MFPEWNDTLRASMTTQAQGFFDDVLGNQHGSLKALFTASTTANPSGLLTLPSLLSTLAKPDGELADLPRQVRARRAALPAAACAARQRAQAARHDARRLDAREVQAARGRPGAAAAATRSWIPLASASSTSMRSAATDDRRRRARSTPAARSTGPTTSTARSSGVRRARQEARGQRRGRGVRGAAVVPLRAEPLRAGRGRLLDAGHARRVQGGRVAT